MASGHRVASSQRDRFWAGQVEAALAYWDSCASLAERWWTRHGGVPAGDVARHRLAALVRFAREASPFYRHAYAHLGAEPALDELPVVTKEKLMERFDDWPTDRRIRRAALERFLAAHDPGERYLDRYVAWKSSGSTGSPGLFVQDAHALAVYDALVAAQWDAPALRGSRFGAAVPRAALIAATGGPFASIASWERVRHAWPGVDARSFSVLAPLERLVAELNDYAPAYLASYPSMLALLARERVAGRLAIAPAIVWSGGEMLAEPTRRGIERAFGCAVVNEYGASECLSIAYGCEAGWLHVNADWVILEGVDADGKPTKPGRKSHTVLVTNLANWVQPVIRYDLGDRIVALGAPCACGNPLPAVKVEGRKDDVVRLRSAGGATVALVPLALATVVEEGCGIHRFQIVQKGETALALRFDAQAGEARARRRALAALGRFLRSQGLANVRIAIAREPPRVDTPSGKLRSVLVEHARCRD